MALTLDDMRAMKAALEKAPTWEPRCCDRCGRILLFAPGELAAARWRDLFGGAFCVTVTPPL